MMTSQNLDIIRLELALRLEKNCQCIPAQNKFNSRLKPIAFHCTIYWAPADSKSARSLCGLTQLLLNLRFNKLQIPSAIHFYILLPQQ